MKKQKFYEVTPGDIVVTVKIYGKNKVIGEYYDVFTINKNSLSKKEVRDIEEYIINKSNIPEERIYFTTIRILEAKDFI